MTSFLLPALLLAAPAHAEVPTITWDAANPTFYAHQAPPLARTLSWSCDDPSDQLPVTQRCQVMDLTAGGLGSGNEFVLVDDDCGTSATDPTSVTHDYDVPSPVDGHRYGYIASCTDVDGRRYRSSRSGWLDATAPTVTLESRPTRRTNIDDPSFEIRCEDASFDWDFSFVTGSYTPDCDLRCTLDRDDGQPVVRTRNCDTVSVNKAGPLGTNAYQNLGPGTYVFSVTGRDGAGNTSVATTWRFTVVLPGEDTGLDAETDDSDDSDDTLPPDTDDTDPPDSDDTDGGTDDSDDTDTDSATDKGTDDAPGDCSCSTPGTPLAALALLPLLALRRRRPTR